MKLIAFSLVILCAATALALDAPFEHEYRADSGVLPQEAAPHWGVRGAGKQSLGLREGWLTAEATGERRCFLVIGQTDDGTAHGKADAWNGSSGEATVDFRFKGSSSDPGFEFFQVQISDGKKQWRIRFFANKVLPSAKNVDASEPDTYRATLKSGLLTLTSAKQGEIFKDRPGSDPNEGRKEIRSAPNCLWFGSFSPNSKSSGSTGNWELEFIRWTNKAALFGPPSE